MNPLTVTWAPHIYTEIGWRNFQNFVNVAGFDNVTGTANGRVHRELTRLAFEALGDPFQPFIYGQKAFPLSMAVKYGIPLVMYGEDGEVEYGGDRAALGRSGHNVDDDLAKHYFSGIGPLSFVGSRIRRQDLELYLPPSVETCRKIGLDVRFFGYYRRWIPQENYYYAAEHADFEVGERNEGTYSKYASLDDRIDGFHYYLGYVKFGIGRATSDTAHEIRDGKITREEGIALVRKFDGEFPRRHFDAFLQYTGLSQDEWEEIVDNWRSSHIWEKHDFWRLKHPIWAQP